MKNLFKYRIMIISFFAYALTGCVTDKRHDMTAIAIAASSHLSQAVENYRFDKDPEKDHQIKTQFRDILTALNEHTVHSVPGEDQIKRSAVVTMQRMVETFIADREIVKNKETEAGQDTPAGSIENTPDQPSDISANRSHKADASLKETPQKFKEVTIKYYTRLPPTPLCQGLKQNPSELASEDMKHDEARLKTITDRKITVRQLAQTDGIKMHLIYLKSGLQPATDKNQKLRSQDQLETFSKELGKPENKDNLVNSPLDYEAMPPEIIGATYLLKNTQDQELFFGLNAAQAIDADADNSKSLTWRVWFGDPSNPEISNRIQELDYYQETGKYVKKTETPDIAPSL